MGIPAPNGVDASGLPPAGDQANAVLAGTITAVGPTIPFAFRGPMNFLLYASVASTLTTTAGSTAATVGSSAGLVSGAAINSVNVPKGTTMGVLAGTNVTLAIPAIALTGFLNLAGNVGQISGVNDTTGLLGATVTGPGIPSGTTVTAIPIAAVAASSSDIGGGAGSPGTPGTVVLSKAPTAVTPGSQPQFFTFARTGNAITVTGADANASYTGAGVVFNATVQIERSFDGGATWIVATAGSVLAQYLTGPVSLTFGEPERNVLYRLNCIAYTSGVINYRISQTGGMAESLAIGPLSGG